LSSLKILNECILVSNTILKIKELSKMQKKKIKKMFKLIIDKINLLGANRQTKLINYMFNFYTYIRNMENFNLFKTSLHSYLNNFFFWVKSNLNFILIGINICIIISVLAIVLWLLPYVKVTFVPISECKFLKILVSLTVFYIILFCMFYFKFVRSNQASVSLLQFFIMFPLLCFTKALAKIIFIFIRTRSDYLDHCSDFLGMIRIDHNYSIEEKIQFVREWVFKNQLDLSNDSIIELCEVNTSMSQIASTLDSFKLSQTVNDDGSWLGYCVVAGLVILSLAVIGGLCYYKFGSVSTYPSPVPVSSPAPDEVSSSLLTQNGNEEEILRIQVFLMDAIDHVFSKNPEMVGILVDQIISPLDVRRLTVMSAYFVLHKDVLRDYTVEAFRVFYATIGGTFFL
jgi:hypothetical protein